MSAGRLEAAMTATLVGSFLAIPLARAHLVLGIAFALLASAHVALRRRVYLAVLRRWRRRASLSAALVGSAAVMVVSGFVQWMGVLAAIPWHGGSCLVVLALGAGHGVSRLRRHRTRRPRLPADPALR